MTGHSGIGREVFVYQVNVGADVREVVSLLDPDTAFGHGICTEAIVGMVRPGPAGQPQIEPERFQENPAFVQFLRELISARIYDVEDLRRAGQQQGEGYLYLLDARTPQPQGQVPPVDATGQLPGGTSLPLCRLRYTGSASTWGFAIYRASHDDYEKSVLPS